jgi:hypothetical protein
LNIFDIVHIAGGGIFWLMKDNIGGSPIGFYVIHSLFWLCNAQERKKSLGFLFNWQKNP